MDLDGKPTHATLASGSYRISMPFIQLGLFQMQQKYLPLRVAPLILALEFGSDVKDFLDTTGGTDVTWQLQDCKLRCTTLQLDNALDNLIQDRWRKDALVLKQ